MNENVSYDASEGTNCKGKFSVWSNELFLYVVDLQVSWINSNYQLFCFAELILNNAILLTDWEKKLKNYCEAPEKVY